MYAIVDIAGKQFKVEKDRFVYAPSVAGDAGASVEFNRVLLVEDDNGVEVGTPTISGARVAGTILEHGRGDKVIVFKKKRRKGYKKTQGHRQGFSKIMIDDILLKGQQAYPKKEKKQEAPQAETKPTEKAAPTSQDDLKKINGLGPKFEEALNEYGIYTYQGLTELSSDTIGRLSDDIDGISAEMLEDDWIPQAKELIGTSDTAEATAPDDLQQINGIGPVFEEALHQHGVHTYQQVIDLSAEEIEKIGEDLDGITVEMVQEDWVPQAKELEANKG